MDRHIIGIDKTLLEALRMLNDLSGSTMALFAVDGKGVMRGTITDGDVRRALVAGHSLQTKVEDVMHRGFRYVKQGATNVRQLREFRKQGITMIPSLLADGTIAEIIDLASQTTQLPLDAVVMAGGKGERLRPLTLDIPKPLLKIGDKAIIDYNIEALLKCGIKNINVTVNYLAEKIEEHIDKQPWHGYVHSVRENQPLGTIGSAALADLDPMRSSIVMNSDLLTTVSFEDMYLHHVDNNADITIAAIPYQVSVPYAILDVSGQTPATVSGLEEKPSYSYFANAGIYIFPNEMLLELSKETRTDATDLIDSAIAAGKKVTYFPISGTWIDIGSPTDYRQAQELMKSVGYFK